MSFAEVYAGSAPGQVSGGEGGNSSALSPSLAQLEQLLTDLRRKLSEYKLSKRQGLLREIQDDLIRVTSLKSTVEAKVRHFIVLQAS